MEVLFIAPCIPMRCPTHKSSFSHWCAGGRSLESIGSLRFRVLRASSRSFSISRLAGCSWLLSGLLFRFSVGVLGGGVSFLRGALCGFGGGACELGFCLCISRYLIAMVVRVVLDSLSSISGCLSTVVSA